MTLPMALHTEAMPDDPTMQAVMDGPLTFYTVGLAHDTTFIPLYQAINQPYSVNWSLVAPGSARNRKIQALATTPRSQKRRTVW